MPRYFFTVECQTHNFKAVGTREGELNRARKEHIKRLACLSCGDVIRRDSWEHDDAIRYEERI